MPEAKYICNDCDATFIREDSAFVHAKDNKHCTVEPDTYREAYCFRADH